MTAQAWILIAAIAAVLLVAFVAGFVLYKRRRISLTPAEAEKKELTDRSGGYTASTGFSFSQGGSTSTLPKPSPEPVRRAPAKPPVTPTERTDDEGQPHIGDDAAVPRDSARRGITDIRLPEPEQGPQAPTDSAALGDTTTEPAPTKPAPTETDTSATTAPTDSAPAEAAPGKSAAPDKSVSGEADGSAPAATSSAAPTRPAPEKPVTPEKSPSSEAGGSASAVAPSPAPTTPRPGTAPTKPATDGALAPEKSAAPGTSASAPAAPVESPAPAAPSTAPEISAPDLGQIDPTTGRLTRLRGRLSRSQNAVGKSLLGLLGGGDLDEDSWEEIEDTLVMADLGTASTTAVVERLREEMAARTVRTADDARAVLRDVLIEALRPELDRSIRALPHDNRPSVLLVVGVNGTGKTTTTGKLARVLVADGRRVLLGAADTFRAAAADQLQTWGERVGAETVRGKEGADPAAVAFDAVSAGIANGVDAVLVDTAGRLHTKTGLMDELGKVKRVVEKKAPVDEVLLVLDSTVGQNGLTQARVFAEVVDITGVVLTKLDGTAKGGIVFQVQHELGVPVKLVGLGEGADDLAPFEPGAFVDALLG
ncbi:signal recognition particle-docking protein FtsY [Nocardia sp. NPDC050406]|uniref:signal recognition particle-docking protein FtsY n=1 Tax=Nocardia sp. NPDC050406 TaxID=3364318 RepID=UPI0037A4EA46